MKYKIEVIEVNGRGTLMAHFNKFISEHDNIVIDHIAQSEAANIYLRLTIIYREKEIYHGYR